jgi:hypothetical protein
MDYSKIDDMITDAVSDLRTELNEKIKMIQDKLDNAIQEIKRLSHKDA